MSSPLSEHLVMSPVQERRLAKLEAGARRALDMLAAGSGLVLLSPVLLVLSILVKLDSPGPVLFRQTRIGRDRRRGPTGSSPSQERRRGVLFGKPFTLYKFRTMYVDSRERFPDLYRYTYSPGELESIPIKVLVGKKDEHDDSEARQRQRGDLPTDPRITKIGRWLRRTSLDELPNLWNVLVGDMHLVGPRPDIAENIRYYTPAEREILRIKPGVTGLAQIRGRGFLTFRETNAYDLEYVRTRSLSRDLSILIGTLPAILRRDGAY